MPELHKLTPYLAVLQGRGLKVALLTDGRMSGASGKVLAAIQVTPEAAAGGAIGRIRDGDILEIDSEAGVLAITTDDNFPDRPVTEHDYADSRAGMGRELFTAFRKCVNGAESGATIFAQD
jgi:phosphogluconate dehydratase